jgi:hypothetical protein
VYIICNVFRQALEDAGFSYTKSIKGFRDRGYIRTIVDADGNERSQHQKKIQGVNVRAILAKISVQQTDDPEDDFLKDPAEPMAHNFAG